MAKQPLKTQKIYVIDTSYLLELFKVDRFYEEKSATEIKTRFEIAIKTGDELFVPLPCIYELGNHVADVRDGSRKRELATTISKTINGCVTKNSPWTITPSASIESLSELWHEFANNYINCTKKDKENSESIGLVDTATICEALRLKEEYKDRSLKVHIWTKDRTLKSHEPDMEENPFVGFPKK